MNKINHILERAAQGKPLHSESREKCENERHLKVMSRLWLAMTKMYGTLWTSNNGDEPDEIWSHALHKFDADQIKVGLDALIDGGYQFPPTLPKFVTLCQGGFENEGQRVIASQQSQQSRPVADVLAIEPMDLGATNILDSVDTMKIREIGNPESNPNYFRDLLK